MVSAAIPALCHAGRHTACSQLKCPFASAASPASPAPRSLITPLRALTGRGKRGSRQEKGSAVTDARFGFCPMPASKHKITSVQRDLTEKTRVSVPRWSRGRIRYWLTIGYMTARRPCSGATSLPGRRARWEARDGEDPEPSLPRGKNKQQRAKVGRPVPVVVEESVCLPLRGQA